MFLHFIDEENHSTLGFTLDIVSLVTGEDLKNVGQSSNISTEDESVDHSSTEEKKLSESTAGSCKQVSVSDTLRVDASNFFFGLLFLIVTMVCLMY